MRSNAGLFRATERALDSMIAATMPRTTAQSEPAPVQRIVPALRVSIADRLAVAE